VPLSFHRQLLSILAIFKYRKAGTSIFTIRSIERANLRLIPRSTEQIKLEDYPCSLNRGQAACFSERDVIAASTVDRPGVPIFLFPSIIQARDFVLLSQTQRREGDRV
jgi:hypothetical protein